MGSYNIARHWHIENLVGVHRAGAGMRTWLC